MADHGVVRLGRRYLFTISAAFLLGLAALGGVACAPYGDGAADMHRHLKTMRARSAEYERGTDLAGRTLVDTLSGRTLVYRYRASPGGYAADTVIYRYFRSDGHFEYIDSTTVFLNLGSSMPGDYWKVDGAHLCVKRQLYRSKPFCYLVARTDDGAIQFYVDDPGGPEHNLLTVVTREIIEGPPPALP
jgi:hypothetical protein